MGENKMKLEHSELPLLFSETVVPDIFFAEYLSQMPANSVKVYLYMIFLSKYNKEIKKIDSEIKIVDKSCPLFVPIVEEGWANTDIASLTAKRYLEELMEEGIDSLVLGCTHYPILKRTIGDIVGDIKIKLLYRHSESSFHLLSRLSRQAQDHMDDDRMTARFQATDRLLKYH